MKILYSLLALLITGAPALAQSNHRHHVALSEAIKSTGVEFKINPSDCYLKENANAFGWYWARANELVVCQENAKTTEQVKWTEEDYDTLRHEAQHLIQDCMDGSRQGLLSSVYKEPVALAQDVMTHEQIQHILKVYGNRTSNTQVMELEAFAVAAINDPLDQARDVVKYCM